MASLLALLDAPGELPAAAIVVGEAGIGKTALWLAALEEAEARGFLVLSCRPSEAEARFSFSGLADLVGGVAAEVLRELPGVQRRALEAALALAESEDSVEESVVAFAFLATLHKLAERNRIVLAVDDLQWLDEPSRALLRYALPRLKSDPVAALLTARGGTPGWLRRDVPDDGLLEVELSSLTVGALHELLRRRLDFPLPRPVLLRVWKTSGGNPFFALELARALQRRGSSIALGAELPLPPSLEELVNERLDGLGSSALIVARVVAALAEPTVGLVEAAAGRRARRGLDEALAAGVLELDDDRLRLTHPLLRPAVLWRSTPSERRSLHARLAELVPHGEERARHLALAAAGPNAAAASALEEAAEAAHSRGAPAAAAELAEQALRLTPDSEAEARRRRTLLAAGMLTKAGDPHRAIALLEEARAAAPHGPARAAVLARLAWAKQDLVGQPEAALLLEEALAEAQGDDALEATVHGWLAQIGVRLPFTPAAPISDLGDSSGRGSERPSPTHVGGSGDRGLEHAELALAGARRAGDPQLHARALSTFGLLHFVAGRGVPRAEMEELEREHGASAARLLAHLLVWSGEEVERARRHLHEYRDAMHARNSLEEIEALWGLSVLEWRAGNWELAARYTDDLIAFVEQSRNEAFCGLAPAIAAHRGEVEDARARAEHELAQAVEHGSGRAQAIQLWVLGFLELSLGNPAAALRHLRPAWEIYDGLGYFEPGHRLELADTLHALIETGELEEAERRLAPWEERAATLDRAWTIAILARCRALVLAARGDLDGAFAAFEQALSEHARSVFPFEHARTLLALGETQRRAKQRREARATLEQALEMFEQLGAPLWAEKARGELKRIGGRAPNRGELTEAERRIAVLVAEGRSNREVAAALFLTEHTVETALTRVYRKLDVRSRAALAHRLSREDRTARR